MNGTLTAPSSTETPTSARSKRPGGDHVAPHRAPVAPTDPSTRRRKLASFALLVALLVCVSVMSVTFLGRAASSKFSSVGAAVAGVSPDSAPAGGAVAAGTAGSAANVRVLDAAPDQSGRQIVSSGTLTVAVDDVIRAKHDTRTTINALGGQVFGEKTELAGRASSTITYKVPPAAFDQALRELGAAGTLEAEEIKTDDVTQQVVDLDARIRSAEASLSRVRDLVTRTSNVLELTNLENEVQRRQTELESLQGQQRTLAARTDMATIVLTLKAKTDPVTATGVSASPGPSSEWPGFFDGLRAGWNGLLRAGTIVGAGLGLLLPFSWLLVPVGVIVVVQRRRRAAPAVDAA